MAFDYQEIIDNLTDERVKSILDTLDIPYEDRGGYLIMPTYCHNHKQEEASRKLYYYKNSKIFVCYTECGGQSIFKFLKNYYEAQGIVYDWHRDIYELVRGDTKKPHGFITPKYLGIRERYSMVRRDVHLPTYSPKVLDCFIKYYPPEWAQENITKEAMDRYNILFSISQNKIIIPHKDVCGNLCGIRGRALNPQEIDIYGKYAPVWIEGKCYSHPLSLNLYGLYENKETIRREGVCFVYEAEKSVLQCESFGIPNCAVAVCGDKFNKFQLNLLLKYCCPQEIVLCFDNEEKKGENKYFNRLWSICQKYKNYCDFSFIYDRKGLTHKKDSPSDRSEAVFKELLSKRVRVR